MNVRRWLLLLLVVLLLSLAPPSVAAPREVAPDEWEDVPRVVAVGDIHGTYDKLTRILVASGLTDAALRWTGGSDHLVLIGDITDRGTREREVIDLLRPLQVAAQAAGGRVHVLLGNHEVMNLNRDLRYVSPEGYQEFAAEESARERKKQRKAWVAAEIGKGTDKKVAQVTFDKHFPPGFLARSREFEDGEYGGWLGGLATTVKINGVVFVHGGINAEVAKLGIQGINRTAQAELREFRRHRRVLEERGLISDTSFYRDHKAVAQAVLEQSTGRSDVNPALLAAAEGILALSESPLLGSQGPLWHRAFATQNERYERDHLASALDSLSARAMVVAHSITEDKLIGERFSGRLYRADVGMAYGGDAQALILEGESVRVLDAAAATTGSPVVEHPVGQGAFAEPIDENLLMALLADAPILADRTSGGPESEGARHLHVRRDTVSASANFWSTDSVANHRRATQELAAHALDRLLGFNLVPITLTREVDGVAGAVQHDDERAVDGRSVEDYDLKMADPDAVARHRARAAVLDALMGNCRRSATEILYLPEESRVLLVNHARAFAISLLAGCGEGAAMPTAPTIDAGLGNTLRALSLDSLTAALGGWLGEQQIRAILVRRDRLLGVGPGAS